ncbi:MAG: PhoX family phosphatase [Rhizobiales bacterium]|nr:PhoX family phosphatase [Hyphomicrobiales bacterium]
MNNLRRLVLDPPVSFDAHDEINFPRPEHQDFDDVVDLALSRRGFLSGALLVGTAGFLTATGFAVPAGAALSGERFAFRAIAANTLDTVTVPEGYRWEIVARWGEPLWSDAPDFQPLTRGTAASQARAFGDNNDGMALFETDGRMVLVCNNEYTNEKIMWSNRESGLPESEDDIIKGMHAHGISIVEIVKTPSGAGEAGWSIVLDSPVNRRITPLTPMEITGPARGHDLLKTSADPSAATVLGTFNNCGSGRTPWGTFLSCEENFNAYFTHPNPAFKPKGQQLRYGIGGRNRGYGWEKVDERFNIEREPNECHRFGYVVELDPMDPNATPKKRTALGRFKHENAEVVIAKDGRVVVYLGDDERGEYLYRFVSNDAYVPGSPHDRLLDEGTLSAAKFHADGSGEWLPLTPATTGMKSSAEICIFTRKAASMVKATTMDRPEWVAAHPHKAEVYCALTNNKNRGVKTNAGDDPMPVDGVNPRAMNEYGQIVRWSPAGGDHAATGFDWTLFVLAGNPAIRSGLEAGSANINADNMFNAPDGIAFDRSGMLWIQTDGDDTNAGPFAGMGNNQMLVGDTQTGEIRRFLVGPRECEITGHAVSEDGRTVFVGIQHPGENGGNGSHFPDGGDSVPRSCVIAISREDGAPIA